MNKAIKQEYVQLGHFSETAHKAARTLLTGSVRTETHRHAAIPYVLCWQDDGVPESKTTSIVYFTFEPNHIGRHVLTEWNGLGGCCMAFQVNPNHRDGDAMRDLYGVDGNGNMFCSEYFEILQQDYLLYGR